MKPSRLDPLALAITGFCLWQSSDLFSAWRHSPFDRLGDLAFLVWTIPLLWSLKTPPTAFPLGLGTLALAVCFLGGLGSLNALKYIGLALALVSLAGRASQRPWFWLGASIAWMPSLGYLLQIALGRSSLNLSWAIAAVRLGLASAAAAWMILEIRRQSSTAPAL